MFFIKMAVMTVRLLLLLQILWGAMSFSKKHYHDGERCGSPLWRAITIASYRADQPFAGVELLS
jgi:hypothetical protein